MKAMFYIIGSLLSLGIIIVGIFASYAGSSSPILYESRPASVKPVHRFMGYSSKALAENYKIRVVSDTIGMPGGTVTELGLGFQIDHLLTREDARKLIVNITQDFLEMLNSDEELKPHLVHYPFTIEDVGISIFSNDGAGESAYDPLIFSTVTLKDKIGYWTKEKGQQFGFKNEYYESYEDAVRLAGLEQECSK